MKDSNVKNKRKKTVKNRIYLIGIILCLLVFGVSAYQLIRYYTQAQKADEEFAQLAEIAEQSDDKGESGKTQEDKESLLERYQQLQEQNHDMAGWIMIKGTQINYPVMYTPDTPDYYLKRNFEKEHSEYGVPYIAEHCDPKKPSDNIIIYGHHMKNGSMFAGLEEFEDPDFYKKHNSIRFDTLTEIAEYEIIAVFKTTVYDEKGFPYYRFTDAKKKQDFTDYVQQCQKLALYDTGVSAEYGDKLLTLSTCEYSRENGRLVVVAKKK